MDSWNSKTKGGGNVGSRDMTALQMSILDTPQKEQQTNVLSTVVRTAQTSNNRMESSISMTGEASASLICANANTLTKGEDMVVFGGSNCNSNSNNNGEVDTSDKPAASNPIHLSKKGLCSVFTTDARKGPSAATATARLTLSGFCHPEETVRLTDSDPMHLLENKYDLRGPGCCVLGHGTFSTVRLGIRRSDLVKVAIKSTAKHDALRSRRLHRSSRHHRFEEWDILQRINNHPNIIKMLDVFETNENIHLVTEYCQGGELFDAIQKKRKRSRPTTTTTANTRRGQYSESQAARITRQILTALNDLHAKNIVHRDVKPENILLTTNSDSNIHAKLCDFGMAVLYRKEEQQPLATAAEDVSSPPSCSEGEVSSPISPLITNTCERRRSYSNSGSDYYTAPEGYFCINNYTAVDIYSLGVTLYILLCGFPPMFSGEGNMEVLFPSETHWKTISVEAKGLIRRMLSMEPVFRITATMALQDEWIIKNVEKSQEARKCHVFDLAIPSKPPRINLNLVRKRLCKAVQKQKESKRRRTGDKSTSRKRKKILDGTSKPLFGRTCIQRRKDFDSTVPASITARNKLLVCPSRRTSSALVVRAIADLCRAGTGVADLKKELCVIEDKLSRERRHNNNDAIADHSRFSLPLPVALKHI